MASPMCCRYYTDLSPELRPIIEKAKASSLGRRIAEKLGKPPVTEGEIFPTQLAPVLASSRAGAPSVFPMVWGFSVPGLSRPVVNARVESAARKPLWQESWKARRCAIPASGYFEWEHLPQPGGRTKTGRKFYIRVPDAPVLWMAGLYRFETFQELACPVFAVVTRPPTPELATLHDRMPLLLPPSVIQDWIRPEVSPESLLSQAETRVILEEAALPPAR